MGLSRFVIVVFPDHTHYFCEKLEIVFIKHCTVPSTICLSIRIISLGSLLTTLYQLTKSEATSFNGFRDLSLLQVFMCKFAMGNNL